jgi:hypothetical protein
LELELGFKESVVVSLLSNVGSGGRWCLKERLFALLLEERERERERRCFVCTGIKDEENRKINREL